MKCLNWVVIEGLKQNLLFLQNHHVPSRSFVLKGEKEKNIENAFPIDFSRSLALCAKIDTY
jgi:hypothetical protein